MNIELHIEQLLLDGIDLPSHEQARLQAALVAELTRLLAEQSLSSQWQMGGAARALQGGPLQLEAHSNSTQLGQQIAQAVHQGFGK